MKTIKGQLTIRCNKDGVVIELTDNDAAVEFVEVKVSPENFAAALGRLAFVECSVTVRNLDAVGKVQEYKPFVFALPKETEFRDKEEVAKKLAVELCPEGWAPDLYFKSKDSFDDKLSLGSDGRFDGGISTTTAKTMIRRWVEKPSDS